MRATPLLTLLFLVCCLSLLPGARASPLYHLSLGLPSYARGYAGSTTIVATFLNNDGLSWLNVSVHFKAKLEPFALPQYAEVIAPGTYAGRGDNIVIPSGYSPGNHTITVEANFQYFDNSTGKWTTPPDSPIFETTTLIVNDTPSTTFYYIFFLPQVAPFGIASALAGLVPLVLIRKRGPSKPRDQPGNSSDGSSQNGPLWEFATSVRGPIYLFLLAVVEPIFSPFPAVSSILAESLAFSGFILASLIALARRKYGTVLFLSILFLGLSATLFSTLATTSYRLPRPYFQGTVEAGFPLPWYTQILPFQAVSICPPASLCPRWFGYIPHNPVNPFYLLVDILFYGALVLGIMTGYKATIIVSRKLKGALLGS